MEAKDTVMSDEELQKVPIDNYRSIHDQREVAKAQDTKTRQATLRETGKWLEQIENKAKLGSRLSALESAIEALKRGEMPEC